MESTTEHESCNWSEKMKRVQLTSKRDDLHLHSAARTGNLALTKEILKGLKGEELREELSKQNHAGETALYLAAEYGFQDVVNEMMKYKDIMSSGIKAKNGYDPLHIASKKGNIDVLKELLKNFPELAMTVDSLNTTALHTAACQGHFEIVNILLEVDRNLTKITKSNGKTALHSAARNGHLAVAKALLENDPGIACRHDNKGQTALHMAVKGPNLELVEELLNYQPSLVNALDMKGNAALHLATRKGRSQVVMKLLSSKETDTRIINKSGETALDTAERAGNSEVAAILKQHGVQRAATIRPMHPACELKQTVSDIKHGVHSQLHHTHQTSRHVLGIAKRLKKLHREGLNNAINSTTIVAVLIATVAFAAIFTVPGQYAQYISPGISTGEANISHQTAFMIFFIFDSVALFISLAVVVVQTSLVVIASKGKKKMMAIINKLMWLACVLTAVSFLALSFVVVGRSGMWLAVGVTIMGTVILSVTLGTLTCWVIANRIEAKKMRSSHKMSLSRSWSRSLTRFSDSELVYGEKNKIYAI